MYPEEEEQVQVGTKSMVSIKETLVQSAQNKLERLKKQVVEQEELVQLLKNNPEVERIFTLMRNGF